MPGITAVWKYAWNFRQYKIKRKACNPNDSKLYLTSVKLRRKESYKKEHLHAGYRKTDQAPHRG